MITIREMNITDYEAMIQLWNHTEGMALSEADSRDSIQRYLERNSGCCYIAVHTDSDGTKSELVGTLLAGHDGRRAYLYHMAVNPTYRGQGIARRMLDASTTALAAQGIDKAHLFVMDSNSSGQQFWRASGWEKRGTFGVFSKDL
ncbi:GNAT family N-acetyltransferase [Paenibacillus sp. WLX2291]|uniref:GNAT family N-acetyltransferase n=1 Tax=Paenibacillus sp. WLX2291 TaxID=3296934 RepID=UPI0039841952